MRQWEIRMSFINGAPPPPRPEDFASTFTLICPVVVLGVVKPGVMFRGRLPEPVAHPWHSDFGTPFGHDSFAICVNGYTVGLVFFPKGEGSSECAVAKWLAWQTPAIIETSSTE